MPKIEHLKRSILYMERSELIELVRETRRQRDSYVPPKKYKSKAKKKASSAEPKEPRKKRLTGAKALTAKAQKMTPAEAAKLLALLKGAK